MVISQTAATEFATIIWAVTGITLSRSECIQPLFLNATDHRSPVKSFCEDGHKPGQLPGKAPLNDQHHPQFRNPSLFPSPN